MATELLTHPDTVTFRGIPLDQIRPSATNPRRDFDPAGLEELAGSIRQYGVLENLIVRPWRPYRVEKRPPTLLRQLAPDPEERPWLVVAADAPEGQDLVASEWFTEEDATKEAEFMNQAERKQRKGRGPLYELVAGERRLRAARLAGVEAVPCVVRHLSDKEVLEIQYIENLHRADLQPVEEAEGYQRLIERCGYTVESLAAKLGKSKAYVYGTLKLAHLPEKARQAVADGAIPKATAVLIARIPNAKLRAQAATSILTGRDASGYRYGDGPLSYRAAVRLIQRQWMIELKQAPFSPKDEGLLPGAGACTTCPKRTGNNREEYPDGRADICTDPDCFRQKKAAHQKRLRERAEAEGQKVLTGKAAAEAIRGSSYGMRGDYVRLEGTCYDDPKRRTYGEILKPSGLVDRLNITLAENDQGELIQLAPKAGVQAYLKEKGIVGKKAAADPDAAKRKAVSRRLVDRAVGRAEAVARAAAGAVPATALKEWVELLRQIAHALVREVWAEKRAQVCRRRGIQTAADDAWLGQHRATALALDRAIAGMGPGETLGFLAELAALRWTEAVHGEDRERKAFWEVLKVDRKAVEKEVRAEFAAKAKAKKPAAKASANGHTARDGAKVIRDQAAREEQPIVQARLNRMANDLEGKPTGWRELPIDHLDLTPYARNRLHLDGVVTLGKLAGLLDAAAAGTADNFQARTLAAIGGIETTALREQIDLARADDDAPDAWPPRKPRK